MIGRQEAWRPTMRSRPALRRRWTSRDVGNCPSTVWSDGEQLAIEVPTGQRQRASESVLTTIAAMATPRSHRADRDDAWLSHIPERSATAKGRPSRAWVASKRSRPAKRHELPVKVRILDTGRSGRSRRRAISPSSQRSPKLGIAKPERTGRQSRTPPPRPAIAPIPRRSGQGSIRSGPFGRHQTSGAGAKKLPPNGLPRQGGKRRCRPWSNRDGLAPGG